MRISTLLTETQKIEMANMYMNGASIRECVQMFNVHKTTVLKWLKIQGVQIRPMKQERRIYSCDETAFDRSNAESAYWFGFLLADGCIYKREGSSYSLNVSISEQDKVHLEKLKAFLCADYPILEERKTQSVRLSIRSDTLCQRLIAKGCPPRKSLTLTYPYNGYFYRRHFIRGYFDGDGSIYVYEKAHCQTTVSFVGTYNFLEKLQEILVFEAGMNVNAIRKHSHSQAKYLSYTGRGNAQRFYDYLYAEDGPYLERKKAKLEYALSYHQRKSVATVGGAPLEVVKQYIEGQKHV